MRSLVASVNLAVRAFIDARAAGMRETRSPSRVGEAAAAAAMASASGSELQSTFSTAARADLMRETLSIIWSDFSSTGFTERVMSTTPSSLMASRNSSLPEFIRTKLYFVIFVIIPVPPVLQLRGGSLQSWMRPC